MSIEVMKQALAALETCDLDYDYEENPYTTYDEEAVYEAITALRQALEQPPNSTTDVVESTDSLSTLLWRDLKTDRQRADWLRLGMGYQTGVVAAAIQQELAMAYERLVGFQKMHATLEQPAQECETCANKRRRLEQSGFLKSPMRESDDV